MSKILKHGPLLGICPWPRRAMKTDEERLAEGTGGGVIHGHSAIKSSLGSLADNRSYPLWLGDGLIGRKRGAA